MCLRTRIRIFSLKLSLFLPEESMPLSSGLRTLFVFALLLESDNRSIVISLSYLSHSDLAYIHTQKVDQPEGNIGYYERCRNCVCNALF